MHEDLMEQVVTQDNATAAWLAVKRNGGAPGIDGMTTTQLRDHVRQHWEAIREKLLAGTYNPSPVRRVEIPKPNGGVRLLGIPTVLDRWIQQMLLQALQAIFDPTFSAHSFGFRPGKSAHDAVRAAQSYVQAGKDWVVDMDITKFFDRVNHDLLMNRIGQTIRDKRVLSLIGRYLRAGVMVEGLVQASEEGTPQGGPLSPLLANILLHQLDREDAVKLVERVLNVAGEDDKASDAAREEIERHRHRLISVVTWMEVLAGPRNDDEEDVIELFVRDFRVVELTRQVARSAVQIRRAHRVRLPDAIIWASARVESALLVTRNTKDFPADDPGVRRPY